MIRFTDFLVEESGSDEALKNKALDGWEKYTKESI